jgi:hypothetical protein
VLFNNRLDGGGEVAEKKKKKKLRDFETHGGLGLTWSSAASFAFLAISTNLTSASFANI